MSIQRPLCRPALSLLPSSLTQPSNLLLFIRSRITANTPQVTKHRHRYEDVRDTALFYPLRELVDVYYEGQYPGLRTLASRLLGQEIQKGHGHCPVSLSSSPQATYSPFTSCSHAIPTYSKSFTLSAEDFSRTRHLCSLRTRTACVW
jgi:hypothetical protein